MKNLILYLITFLFVNFSVIAEVINSIEVTGNKRISKETIVLFGKIKINEDYTPSELNNVLKELYKTNFFKDVKLSINNNILKIQVDENPIIQKINIEGVKNKKIIETLYDNLKLKEKNSFLKNKVKQDQNILKNILKVNGYYFSDIDTSIKKNDNNTVDLTYNIDLGERAYIEKIKFIGDKKIKDRKLRNIIVSEERKFWKFISKKKYLDKNRIKLDEKLLSNYYKNNGYYNVKVNTTSAQVIKGNNFELIFNIDAGEKHFIENIKLNLPKSFNRSSFSDIDRIIKKQTGKIYSLNKIKKILDEIDKIALMKEYEFINASYSEKIENNNIYLTINLNESKKTYVERINILGNYLTNENVIRNSIITDEGDPYNEILFKKSINNIKSKNIFSSVTYRLNDGNNEQSKIIDIEVEEKPTGEISAGAGTGTSGTQFQFGFRENNYLGQGVKLNASANVSENALLGVLSITNPNFKNSDKSLITSIENSREDLMSKYGYETSKLGFSFGTSFEQFQDIFFSPIISTYYETLDTSSKASAAKKKQEGSYFDSNFEYSLSLNKLNQNFQPTDGYKSTFRQSLPIVADDKTITNTYEYSKYKKLGNDTVLSFLVLMKAANSIDDDVRVSKRVFIPSRKLRGFVSGKIGPKDGGDYIGGNYGSAVNFAATLPKLFADLQNVDLSLFLDTANLFGVDYDSSLDSNKIRSSTGLAVDWFTPIGPLSFSFATPITKASGDETESFRFRIGTSF